MKKGLLKMVVVVALVGCGTTRLTTQQRQTMEQMDETEKL